MIIYKPTGEIFDSRKDCKKAFGTNRFNRLMHYRPQDFEFITKPNIATNDTNTISTKEIHSNE